MNKWKTYTLFFTLITFVVIIAYDFLAIFQGGTEASISHLIKVWGHKYPLIPFVFGLLCGHFFWGVKKTKELKVIDNFVQELDKE